MNTLFAFLTLLPHSIIQPYSLQDINQVKKTPYYQMARIVAHQRRANGAFGCTGFRLGATLFMSNLHCFMRAQEGGEMVMGHETGSNATASFPIQEILISVADLDFVLLRTGGGTPVNSLYPSAKLHSGALLKNTALIVPGHSAVQTKQIDISPQCQLTHEVPFFKHQRYNIQHQCDTIGGASGSPMIDRKTGRVIGLHWGGKDGSGHNHGISMPMILEYLKREMPEILSELSIE